MIDSMIKDAATSSVLMWTREAVVARRTNPPVHEIDGTGLPIAARMCTLGVAGIGVDAAPMSYQVQGFGAGRGVVVPGIPPRGRPVRC